MALVSVNEASKLVNKSIKTIYRHIDNGKLSFSLDNNNNKAIYISELIRVYGSINSQIENDNNGKMSDIENDGNHAKIELLENENKMLKELLLSKEDHISSLKQAMLLIEHKDNDNDKTKKGFFARLFNK